MNPLVFFAAGMFSGVLAMLTLALRAGDHKKEPAKPLRFDRIDALTWVINMNPVKVLKDVRANEMTVVLAQEMERIAVNRPFDSNVTIASGRYRMKATIRVDFTKWED